jgi:hypothetical protein
MDLIFGGFFGEKNCLPLDFLSSKKANLSNMLLDLKWLSDFIIIANINYRTKKDFCNYRTVKKSTFPNFALPILLEAGRTEVDERQRGLKRMRGRED